MPAEPPPGRRRAAPPRHPDRTPPPRPARPVEDPTSQLPATPPTVLPTKLPTPPPGPGRPRHAAPSEPVAAPRHAAGPAPTRVPPDPERTSVLGRVGRRSGDRPAEPRHATPRPQRAPAPPPAVPLDPPTTAMPPAPRRDPAATTRVTVDAERTTALDRVERTVVVPRARREEGPTPERRRGPARPGPAPEAHPPAAPVPNTPPAQPVRRTGPTPVPARAEPAPVARPPAAPVPNTPPPLPAEPVRTHAEAPPEAPRPPSPAPAEPAVSPLRGLAWRAGLVLLSVLVALIGAPAVVAAPVVLGTVAAVAERVARHRRRGLLDLVVTAAAGTSAAFALLGVALHASPTGISTAGWAIGGGLLALGALGWCARRPVVPGVPQLLGRHHALRRPDPLTAACTAGAVLVLAATLVLSVLSAQANQQPPLQISAGAPVDGRVLVRIDAGSASGFYDVVLDVDGVRTVAALAVRLEPGQAQVVPVEVPPVPRALVLLIPPGGTDPLRQLIVTNTPQEGR